MTLRLPDKRYEEIKACVVHLFKSTGLKSMPVNAWKLAEGLNIELIAFSELTNEQREAALRLSNGGLKFRLENENESRLIALYDDSVDPGRQRFSILHEIGHFVLGHKQDSELADAEADFFAKFAIAPPMLVHISHPADYLDIAETFGLSKECAFNSMSYYNKWLRISDYKDYEYALVSLFTSKEPDGSRTLRVKRSA